jgi:hypothetical protein
VSHVGVPAAFEHVQKAGDVALDVGMGVFKGVANTWLRGQVDHLVEVSGGEQGLRGGTVRQVCFLEFVSGGAGGRSAAHIILDPGQTGLFERDIVVITQAVEADDVFASFKQCQADRAANKTRGACDKNLHGGIVTPIDFLWRHEFRKLHPQRSHAVRPSITLGWYAKANRHLTAPWQQQDDFKRVGRL